MNALPKGWTKTPIDSITTLNPKTIADDALQSAFSPMQYLGTRFLTRMEYENRAWGEIKKAYVHFQPRDVIVAKVTPCFENGKAGIVPDIPNGIGAGSSEFCVFRPSQGIDERYLLAWLSTEDFRRRATVAMTGSVGLKRVPKDIFLSEEIPLAPEKEQRRIADKLDTVLTRVDALNDRLARIAPLLKRFRQSVLAAATSGRLTGDWHFERDVEIIPCEEIKDFRGVPLPALPASWKWVEFSKIATVKSDLRDPDKYPNELHLAPNHIEPWSGLISGCQTIALDSVKSPKHWFPAGKIVYSKIRPNLCKVAIPNFSGLCSADMYPISTSLKDHFLLLWMLGEKFTSWASNAESRTVLPKINSKELGKIPVPVPSIEEQTEIVHRVEILFAFADRLEARLQTARTAADRLTPALLAKAFRGELVPQDPNDEPASELLRRLREARAAEVPAKKTRGRKAA